MVFFSNLYELLNLFFDILNNMTSATISTAFSFYLGGVSVTTCNLAKEALQLLRERKDGFDIVISDVNMPDMDGFKLLEHVGLEMDLPVISEYSCRLYMFMHTKLKVSCVSLSILLLIENTEP